MKQYERFIKKAQFHLQVRRSIPIFINSLLIISSIVACILFVSRFFVFVYYMNWAIVVAVGIAAATMIYLWVKRVTKKAAISRYDDFFPENELITLLSLDQSHSLFHTLQQRTEHYASIAFSALKKDKQKLFSIKKLVGIVIFSFIALFSVFYPADVQEEANKIAETKKIVNELKAELEKIK